MTKATPRSSGQLFAEPDSRPGLKPGTYIANIDGAARGNPGPASYAVVLRRPDGTPLDSLGRYIGRQTNNVAEYYALIAALDYAAVHNLRHLRVQSDSELLVRQMKGIYKVKSPDLRPLHERARKMAAALDTFVIEHVPREKNTEADALANETLDTVSDSHGKAAPLSPGRTVRAEFRGGALQPLEPLELPEGTVVRIRIERREKP